MILGEGWLSNSYRGTSSFRRKREPLALHGELLPTMEAGHAAGARTTSHEDDDEPDRVRESALGWRGHGPHPSGMGKGRTLV